MTDTSGHDINKGDRVAWNWGRGHAEGVVAEIHNDHVEKTIAGRYTVIDVLADDLPGLHIFTNRKARHARRER